MLKKQYWYLLPILGLTLTLWIHHRHRTELARAETVSAPIADHPTLNARLAKVEPGEDLLSILGKFGFTDQESFRAIADARLPKKFLIAPGEIYRITRRKNRVDLRFYDHAAPIAYHLWRERKLHTAIASVGGQIEHIKFDVRVVTVRGRVENSLIESVAHAVGDELVAYRFMDAFLLDTDFPKDLQRDAAFSLTIEKLYDRGEFIRFGKVRRAELELAGHNVIRVYEPLRHGGIFFARSLDSVDRPFYAPVDHIQISSLFNRRRYHPIKHRIIPHLGVDFETSEGQPVYAAANGQIERMGRNHAAGRFVVLRHSNGYQSFYDHLSQIADIHPGQNVSAGQVLGYVGCSGYCTRPHLHFAVKRFGVFINPIHLIRGYAFDQRREIASLLSHR